MSLTAFIRKRRTFLNYCLYGFLASLLETGLYSFFYLYLSLSNVVSTLLSWVLTVVFAFFSNKCFVYKSKDWGIRLLCHEILSFFSCRLVSGLFNLVWMTIFVDYLKCNGVVMKVLSALIVGIFNFVMGKLVIFSRIRKNQQIERHSI